MNKDHYPQVKKIILFIKEKGKENNKEKIPF